jgi:hypothetical protein
MSNEPMVTWAVAESARLRAEKAEAQRNHAELLYAASQDALREVMAEHSALVAAARPFLLGLDDVPTPEIGYVVCVTAEEGELFREAMPELLPETE